MRKLGKKINYETETIEAFCYSCTVCGCGGCSSCGICAIYGSIESAKNAALSSVNYNTHSGSLTSTGSAAALG